MVQFRSENGGPVKFSSVKAIVVSAYEKPWSVVGGVPGECIEGEPGVVGELFKESVDCGRHLQSVPGQNIPVTTGCDGGWLCGMLRITNCGLSTSPPHCTPHPQSQ